MKVEEERSGPEETRPVVPEALAKAAADAGWPDGMVERYLRLHFSEQIVQQQIAAPLEWARRGIELWERLAHGTLKLRDATYMPKDFDGLVDLFANSPEDIGEWEVTVERSPNPLAQFALQSNNRVRVLEDKGLFIGAFAASARETFVAGRPITVSQMSGYRIRRDLRGQGFSQLLSWLPPAVGTPYAQGQWFHIRSQNMASVQWINALNPDLIKSSPQRYDDVPGIDVHVLQYRGRSYDGDVSGIRRASMSDLEGCVSLINRTHAGLDLFTPYTVDILRYQLDERIWGPKPDWWGRLYGWEDYFVLEEDGRVVACAGLWDKGRDVRERWRLKSSGDEKLIDTTAVLDFGFAEGRDEAMARLIAYLIGETRELERGYLVAPLQFLPEIAARLEDYEPVAERRGLIWRTFDGNFNQMPEPDPPVTRPYTDLAYW